MAHIELGRFLNKSTDSVTVAQGDAGGAAWLTAEQNQLVPAQYDFIDITYDAAPNDDDIIQVVYKIGGASGITVATLTITYDSNRNIKTVTRV